MIILGWPPGVQIPQTQIGKAKLYEWIPSNSKNATGFIVGEAKRG